MSVDRSAVLSCPFCSSTDTELESLFGQQLRTAQYYCHACRTPFECIKGEHVVADAERSFQPGQTER